MSYSFRTCFLFLFSFSGPYSLQTFSFFFLRLIARFMTLSLISFSFWKTVVNWCISLILSLRKYSCSEFDLHM